MFRKGDVLELAEEKDYTGGRVWFPIFVFVKYVQEDEFDCIMHLQGEPNEPFPHRSWHFWYMDGRHVLTERNRNGI